jgi:SAM-dependent methyltransferase
MERDWDLRARSNARFYIECGNSSSEEEFDASGRNDLAAFVLRDIELDGEAVVLEIGCGLGRLLKPLAAMVKEIHGVDVSGEMIEQARVRLKELQNIHLHKTSGSDVSMMPDQYVDFCYSFITFQHVPEKKIIHHYFQEVSRILKPGGLFRFQVDGRSHDTARQDSAGTWCGVVFHEEEIQTQLSANGFRILNLSGIETQYMLVTALRVVDSAELTTAHIRYTKPPWNQKAVHGFVRRLCREDCEEKAARLLEGGTSVRRLANEFLQYHQPLSVEDYVHEVYAVFLGRLPDEEALRHLVDSLNVGQISRDEVAETIIASAEFDRMLSNEVTSVWPASSVGEFGWPQEQETAAHLPVAVMLSAVEAVANSMAEAGVSDDDEAFIQEVAQEFITLARPAVDTDVDALPKAWLTPEEEALIPPRHLWIGPQDPISHYYRWIWEYLAYLTLLCDLHREASVLELGCGHGRTARGLLDYLREPGGYWGLDVDRQRIQDAQMRLEMRHPHFRFVWADVYNAHYNPEGSTTATSYVFPFPDAHFDVLYAASLFTHLLPDEAHNYFQQSRRVLKPGGTCLFSFFVLDHYRGIGTTISPLYEFDRLFPGHAGVAVRDLDHPDALIGYSVAELTSLAESAGLRIVRVIPGLWSQSPGVAVNEQDLVLLYRDT